MHKMTKTFEQKQKEQKAVIASTTNAIKHILEMRDDVQEINIKQLISLMLWKFTEADGLTAKKRTNYKYKLTYISEDTLNKLNKIGEDNKEYIKGLVHEHVYTRDSLIKDLLLRPKDLNSILKNAVGCIVTKEEDVRLREVDKTKICNGWLRYHKANIKIYKRIRDSIGDEKFELFQ